jgi:hypothetical protein
MTGEGDSIGSLHARIRGMNHPVTGAPTYVNLQAPEIDEFYINFFLGCSQLGKSRRNSRLCWSGLNVMVGYYHGWSPKVQLSFMSSRRQRLLTLASSPTLIRAAQQNVSNHLEPHGETGLRADI